MGKTSTKWLVIRAAATAATATHQRDRPRNRRGNLFTTDIGRSTIEATDLLDWFKIWTAKHLFLICFIFGNMLKFFLVIIDQVIGWRTSVDRILSLYLMEDCTFGENKDNQQLSRPLRDQNADSAYKMACDRCCQSSNCSMFYVASSRKGSGNICLKVDGWHKICEGGKWLAQPLREGHRRILRRQGTQQPRQSWQMNAMKKTFPWHQRTTFCEKATKLQPKFRRWNGSATTTKPTREYPWMTWTMKYWLVNVIFTS